jgi:hypothetical protein
MYILMMSFDNIKYNYIGIILVYLYWLSVDFYGIQLVYVKKGETSMETVLLKYCIEILAFSVFWYLRF